QRLGVLAQLRGEAVAGVDARCASERVLQRPMLGDQRGRPAPRRDRVKRLHEARAHERAGAVALAARPANRLKLGAKSGNLGRSPEAERGCGHRSAVLLSDSPFELVPRLVTALGSCIFAGASFCLFPGESMTRASDGTALAFAESQARPRPLRLLYRRRSEGRSGSVAPVSYLETGVIYCD